VERAKDPIDKVKALTRLERAREVDGDALRADFMAHVVAWTEATGVTGSALVNFGVPHDDLVEAGLLDPPAQRKRARAPEPTVRRRAERLSLDEVTAKAPYGDFTLADLAAAIDRGPPTARNYVTRLIEAGVLVEVGPDPHHAGKGMAPMVYRRA
jgi:hypothetical protein